MAPINLEKRQQYYCNGYYYYDNNCGDTAWGSYGRWILLAAIIIGIFFVFLIFSCLTARRRRRQGLNPYRFTGWAGGPAHYNNQQPYGGTQPPYGGTHPPFPNNQYANNATSPPVYSPPKENYGGSNQGYFGGQQSGIELQAPGSSYQPPRGNTVYAAPEGPPPVKGDGIIR